MLSHHRDVSEFRLAFGQMVVNDDFDEIRLHQIRRNPQQGAKENGGKRQLMRPGIFEDMFERIQRLAFLFMGRRSA